MHYTEDNNYREGKFVGNNIADRIETTVYKNIETAIIQKEILVSNFEKEFGYQHEQESFDRNYTFNMGILDAFKERLKMKNNIQT